MGKAWPATPFCVLLSISLSAPVRPLSETILEEATTILTEGDPERAIPCEIRAYLELVDWSGRAVIEGKRGSIPENLPPILERLKIDPAAYIKFINRSEKNRFGNFIGPVEAIRDLAERFGESILSLSC